MRKAFLEFHRGREFHLIPIQQKPTVAVCSNGGVKKKKNQQQEKKNTMFLLKKSTVAALMWLSLVWQIPGASEHEYGPLKGILFLCEPPKQLCCGLENVTRASISILVSRK